MIKEAVKGLLVAFVLLNVTILVGCCPVLKKEAQLPGESLRQVRLSFHLFPDDMDLESLILALRRNKEYLDRMAPTTMLRYGADEFTVRQVRESQEAFVDLLSRGLDPGELSREIRKRFRIYRAAGRVGDGSVLFTGYFEPVYEGRLTPDDTFKYPLYRQPDDLTRIDLSMFNDKFKGESIVARIEGNRVSPYYSRVQIESERALKGKDLEIAWLKDPVDVAFLHIQGSGKLKLSDGKDLLVQYQAANGRPYRSIGRYMVEKGFLAREEVSMQAIRRYLIENPEIVDEVLNYNPSYIFFRQVEQGPVGSLGVLLTPGRSIALDSRIFPKGAVGFISCRKPVVDSQGDIVGWVPFSRFVLNQDTGGAIKGAGRADLFWGSGPYAELAAGHMQHDGELYFLIKKP
jgi:membrane-bound lytic murein transglycosylase A